MSSHDSRKSRFGDLPADAGGGSTSNNSPDDDGSPGAPADSASNVGDPSVRSSSADIGGSSAEFPSESFTFDGFDAEEIELGPRWDDDDPRRKADCFAPPKDPCECYCLHCGRTFGSEGIWFQQVVNDPQGFKGFWMCPTPNCSGAGFTFDIFPTDQDHPANEGWHYDDDEDDESDDSSDDDDSDGIDDIEWVDPVDVTEESTEYDPDEPRYKELEDLFGPDEDDLEGEEWKYGLQPGERPVNPLAEEAEQEWRREQEMHDEPDQRPRILDWSDRPDRKEENRRGPHAGGDMGGYMDDDIPF